MPKDGGLPRHAADLSLLLAVAMVLGGVLLMSATPAQAHVARDVGAYHFVVGWGSEPAYAGQLNSVQLVLTSRATGKPVVNLGNSLGVTVVYGSVSLRLALLPTFDPDTGLGTPGDYRGWIIPTAPGNYTFHFTGSIGTQKIDQSFTSCPTTFATVQDPSAIEFPVQAPSNAELAQRLSGGQADLATTGQASNARLFGIIGIAVGAAGLIAAGYGLLVRRS